MKKIVTTLGVDIALRTLDAPEVQKVQAWFARLRNWDKDAYVRRHSHRLEDDPAIYLLTPRSEIRIFFQIDGDTITILDVTKESVILASNRIPEKG